MGLIYEKRVLTDAAEKDRDFGEKPFCKRQSIDVLDKGTSPLYISNSVTDRRVKSRIRAMRKKRHRVRRLLFATFTFLLCLAFLDLKFFGGRIALSAVSLSKKSNDALPSLISGTSAFEAPKRTIYTMEYAADNAVKNLSAPDVNGGQDSKVYTKEPDTAVEADTAVSGKANLDGVTYYPITEMDLAAQSVFALSNGTDIEPDVAAISNNIPLALQNISITDEPLVLIVHTHAGECYTRYEGMYPEGDLTRTYEDDKNVIRVGREIAETLSHFGICTLHSQIHHDEQSFINAYSESAKTVKSYLEQYPSIRFVIDVHRDAIIRDDGESIKAVKNIAGENYAQLMFVVGTNELGHKHDGWRENLSLAMTLQQSIEDTYPGLCRSINLRDVPFNQQLSCGYLLLEVGTCSNTLDEALLSARAFGENLARTIYGAQEN